MSLFIILGVVKNVMIKAGTSDIWFDTSSVDSLGAAAYYIVGDAVPGIWTVSA